MFLSYFIVNLRDEIWHKLKVGAYMIDEMNYGGYLQTSWATMIKNRQMLEIFIVNLKTISRLDLSVICMCFLYSF